MRIGVASKTGRGIRANNRPGAATRPPQTPRVVQAALRTKAKAEAEAVERMRAGPVVKQPRDLVRARNMLASGKMVHGCRVIEINDDYVVVETPASRGGAAKRRLPAYLHVDVFRRSSPLSTIMQRWKRAGF